MALVKSRTEVLSSASKENIELKSCSSAERTGFINDVDGTMADDSEKEEDRIFGSFTR